jgi:ribonucleotide reductase beta subunit family protein with ferritin-like domain
MFNSANPFSWMQMINMETKGNFFEVKISNYQRPKNNDSTKFELNNDF